MNELDKEKELKEYLQSLKKVAVAFSSGVDSTYLLKIAHDVLKDNVIAITASSHVFPKRELEETKAFCEKENIKHIIFYTDELKIEGFASNPTNRCYICKKALFQRIKDIALENDINYVIEGSNMDDLGDYRPGLKAIEELKIKSPLRQVELYKSEIRNLSKKHHLPTFNKPSFACLASRFVYGEMISEEKLEMVEKAEQLLIELGFKQMRVRIHGRMARIEVEPEYIQMVIDNRNIIDAKFKEYGFDYVTVDLYGYKMGNMNKLI